MIPTALPLPAHQMVKVYARYTVNVRGSNVMSRSNESASAEAAQGLNELDKSGQPQAGAGEEIASCRTIYTPVSIEYADRIRTDGFYDDKFHEFRPNQRDRAELEVIQEELTDESWEEWHEMHGVTELAALCEDMGGGDLLCSIDMPIDELSKHLVMDGMTGLDYGLCYPWVYFLPPGVPDRIGDNRQIWEPSTERAISVERFGPVARLIPTDSPDNALAPLCLCGKRHSPVAHIERSSGS